MWYSGIPSRAGSGPRRQSASGARDDDGALAQRVMAQGFEFLKQLAETLMIRATLGEPSLRTPAEARSARRPSRRRRAGTRARRSRAPGPQSPRSQGAPESSSSPAPFLGGA